MVKVIFSLLVEVSLPVIISSQVPFSYYFGLLFVLSFNSMVWLFTINSITFVVALVSIAMSFMFLVMFYSTKHPSCDLLWYLIAIIHCLLPPHQNHQRMTDLTTYYQSRTQIIGRDADHRKRYQRWNCRKSCLLRQGRIVKLLLLVKPSTFILLPFYLMLI